MIRHLITVFAFFIAVFFCVPVFAEDDPCVATDCMLLKQGFTPAQVKTIVEIKSNNFPIELQVISTDGNSMVVIMPNGGGFLLYTLNQKGVYSLFASIP